MKDFESRVEKVVKERVTKELKAALSTIGGYGEEPKVRVRVRVHTNGKTRKAKANGKGSSRKLQGSYMGSIRHLSAKQKDEVKELRQSKGIVAAIRLAKKFDAERTTAS